MKLVDLNMNNCNFINFKNNEFNLEKINCNGDAVILKVNQKLLNLLKKNCKKIENDSYIIRISYVNSIIFSMNNKLIYSGKRSKHLCFSDNYDFDPCKRIEQEIMIINNALSNNLCPKLILYNDNILGGKTKLLLVMKEIKQNMFLNNIFKVKNDGVKFCPPNDCSFEFLKDLFYKSMNELHKLGIVHNDLVISIFFKRIIHNSYYDEKDKKVKFIDFSLSYYPKQQNIDSKQAFEFEKESVDKFFNDFEYRLN